MSTEDEIFAYLTQSENLPFALEISDYIEQLKHKLHREFWSAFNPQMEQKLGSTEFSSTWEFHSHPASRYRTEWGKSYFFPIREKRDEFPMMVVAFGQGSRANDFRFFWGTKWNFEPEQFDNPAMTILNAELVSRGMNNVEKDWPGWGNYKYRPYESQFMMRMYNEREQLISEIVDDVWQLFAELRPIIENINRTVINGDL